MGVKTDKIDTALKKIHKEIGRIRKVYRWLRTTNDFNGVEEWLADEKLDAILDLSAAQGRLYLAAHVMGRLKHWQEAHE